MVNSGSDKVGEKKEQIKVRHGSQIWLQLSAASPTNSPLAKVTITKVIVKLKLVVRRKLRLN